VPRAIDSNLTNFDEQVNGTKKNDNKKNNNTNNSKRSSKP